MQRKIKNNILMVLCAVILAVSTIGCDTATLYGVTTWDSDCAGNSLSTWDDMGLAWYNEATDDIAHANALVAGGTHIDGDIVDSLFTDTSLVAWGMDHSNVDMGTASMIFMHGGISSNRWFARVRVNEAGSGNCNTWQGDMLFGNTALDFLHLSSCHSADQVTWGNWGSSFSGIHQVNGFHGCMWIGAGLISDYSGFADDAFTISIADAWFDNMYHDWASYDQCPVSLTTANNITDAATRFTTESYSARLDDAPIGASVYAYRLVGCDPDCEGPITGSIDPGSSCSDCDDDLEYSADYVSLINDNLPDWNKEILKDPGVYQNWTEDASIISIAEAIDRNILKNILLQGNVDKNSVRYEGDDRLIKMDKESGYIRFINNTKTSSAELLSMKPVSVEKAKDIVSNTGINLGLPISEFKEIKVKTLGISGPKESIETERFITVDRQVNNLPVFNSMYRAAVSNNEEISRVLIRWPDFRLSEFNMLRDRKAVIDEIVTRIKKEIVTDVSIRMILSYIPTGDKEIIYEPGIVVMVRPKDSAGMIFTVSIVE